jgi:Icc-related predicted phosphoesterase
MCERYNKIPTYIPYANRIIAIGDLHGDITVTIQALKIAKVIDDEFNWIGGDTVVVQIGDQLDSCRKGNCNNNDNYESDIKVLLFFTDLDKLARKHGGYVISLFGNHELMNIMGDMRYVSTSDYSYFNNYRDPTTKIVFKNSKEARIHAFKRGGEMSNFLACTRIGILAIGSLIFVHGGILPSFLQNNKIQSLSDLLNINEMIRDWLLQKAENDIINNTSNESIFWTRDYGRNISFLNSSICDTAKKVFNILQVGTMIIGHTPNPQINSICDGKIWRIDTGMSRAFNKKETSYIELNKGNKNNKIQVLEILDGTKFNILA